MMETKQKILQAAEGLFFQYGIANVRLQQIADEAGISVGNLAYHYKNKEAIVLAIYEKVFTDFEQLLGAYLLAPGLQDFDQLFVGCYHVFTQNPFYINNVWEINRNHPSIRKHWQGLNQKMISQIRKRLQFNIERGALVQSPLLAQLDDVAQNLWLTITFWISQQMLLGKKSSLPLYRKVLWSQLLPYVTANGRAELDQILAN